MKVSSLKWFLLGGAAAPLAAYASWDGLADSIHFYSKSYNDYYWSEEPQEAERMRRHYVDLGRAPQEIMVPGWNLEMRRGYLDYGYNDWDTYYERTQQAAKDRSTLIARARNLEVQGRYKESIQLFEKIADTPALRSFVRDRRELLKGRTGRPTSQLAQYLRSRYILEFHPGNAAGEMSVLRWLSRISGAELKPHIDYAVLGSDPQTDGDQFWQFVLDHPFHPRGDAARLMTAAALLKESRQPSAGELDIAERSLRRLLSQKESPYHWKAVGWQARVDLLRGKVDAALQGYFDQLAKAATDRQRFEAYDSIAICHREQGLGEMSVVAYLRQRSLDLRSEPSAQGSDPDDWHKWQVFSSRALNRQIARLSPVQAERLQARLLRDADLLESYLAYRIEDTDLMLDDERDLASFAEKAVQSFDAPKGGPLSRAAQLLYNSGQYEKALAMSKRALAIGTPDQRGRARYVHAASLGKLGSYEASLESYRLLNRPGVPGYLRHGGLEALALLEERHGDPVKALEAYQALNYQLDIAYLADAKLSTDDLARFVRRMKGRAGESVFQYTLGMRHLRRGEYSQSRRAFSKLSRSERLRGGMDAVGFKAQLEWIKSEGYPIGVDPLTTVADLERFDRIARNAKSSEARAQALYDQAAYIYKRKHLLFYSVGLWKGSRSFSIDMFWSQDFNDQTDQARLNEHRNEHECLAHTMRLCQTVIEKYPDSSIRPKALYTGAVATQRLANLNAGWRQKSKPLMTKASNWMNQLAREYPENALAKDAKKYAAEWMPTDEDEQD